MPQPAVGESVTWSLGEFFYWSHDQACISPRDNRAERAGHFIVKNVIFAVYGAATRIKQ
jgi:hypothetical protein